MSTIVQMLTAQRAEIKQRIDTLLREQKDIEIALAAIEGSHAPDQKSTPAIAANGPTPPMSINEGIVEAVRSGADTPSKIFAFLKPHLGIETTKNSVNTRLGRLREQELIDHNGKGWVPKKNVATSKESGSLP